MVFPNTFTEEYGQYILEYKDIFDIIKKGRKLYYIVYTPNVKMKRGTNILNRNDTSQTISLPTGN